MKSNIGRTPLLRKLGIKEGDHVCLISPCNTLQGELTTIHLVTNDTSPLDYAHVFANKYEEMHDGIKACRARIKPDGMIWASWYKKSSKKQDEVNEDVIREIAFTMDLVDVKVCAIDSDWSALKLVIRKALRKS